MEAIFGSQGHLTIGQECVRAVLIFLYGLVMLRISGKRTFSQWSALDVILSIVVGSCLSRALTGSAPFSGTLAAVGVLVCLHIAAGYASARFKKVSAVLEGVPVTLVQNGELDDKARLLHLVSHCDLDQALREHELRGLEDLKDVALVKLEPNGKLSVLRA